MTAMLRNTFCHLPGVGAKTERDLWGAGLTSWEAALAESTPRASHLRRSCLDHLRESVGRYAEGDAAYFSARLSAAQQWRLFTAFRDTCSYLDIETTGMASGRDHVTTISLYDGRCVRCYVRGDNLDDFVRDVAGYQVLVTYNGRCFDLPFLERDFGITLDQAHIDLRYVLKGLGVSGGLKRCEQQLGLRRGDLEEVDGYMAVQLWEEYRKHHSRRALETLLAYNVQDTVNLETLLVLAHNRHVADTPFAASHAVSQPAPAVNPFRPDADLVQRLAATRHWQLPFPG
jgi:uncharacterized protein YprB with RNaseH-like and TPR domain